MGKKENQEGERGKERGAVGEEWEMMKQEEKYKKGTNKKNQEVKESNIAAIFSKRQGEKNKEHERLRILFSGAKEKRITRRRE